MHRLHTFSQNRIILQKAIKYSKQGVVGLDVAGPDRKSFSMQKHALLFQKARAAGLGVTVHTGETMNLKELEFVVKHIRPDRIGHGIQCVKDKDLMKEIAAAGIVLETCPSSNLHNSVVKNVSELKSIYQALLKHKVKFTINTDGPEMYRTNIHKEQEFLITNKILTRAQIDQCTKWAFDATFIKTQAA
jgi:adenosine deaminase